MYILNGNKEFRNLEEQVQKNKEDIANHYAIDRALANLGIEVVGQITSADELPNPATYLGAYGDTYAVGNKEEVDLGLATYMYYVFTRPDPNAGYPNNYWLNVGSISIVGPRGPEGPKGDKGDTGTSTRWYMGSGAPIYGPGYKYNDGDMWLNSRTGEVYIYSAGGWSSPQAYLKGPQGIQGPQGEKGDPGPQGEPGPRGIPGDVGGFINIWGILDNEGQLPLPTTLNNLTVAYLVTHGEHYDLYVQVGENSQVATWNNVGPFNAATLVTVGGIGQNVWDADSKVDKADGDGSYRVYGVNPDGSQARFTVKIGPGSYGQIPMYDAPGQLKCANPSTNDACATKGYVDNKISTDIAGKLNAVSTATGTGRVYAVDAYGNQKMLEYGGVRYNGVAVYSNDGRLYSFTPYEATHVAPKQYVDDKFAELKAYVDEQIAALNQA